MLLLLLAACEYLDPEKVGAYDCSEYCEQVLDKTQECADEAGEDLDAYAAAAREDWEGKARADMVASCEEDLEGSGKSDTQCQAETATINNLTCDEILGVLEDLAAAAE